MPRAYVTLDAMKDRLDIAAADTDDDDRLRADIEAASAWVEDYTGRVFQPRSRTVTYSADFTDLLPVDDLLSLTTLSTLTVNSNGTRTYGDTWATTDYDLLPFEPQDEPYWAIQPNPQGRYTFPRDARGVQLTGLFGYTLDTVSVGTLGANLTDSALTLTMSASPSVETLHTLLIGSEQLYVTGVDGVTVTVAARGANGTAAASHLSGAAVSAYRYPASVIEATALETVRLFRRTDAPFGVTGSPEVGQLQVITKLDPDAVKLLRRFRRTSFGAA